MKKILPLLLVLCLLCGLCACGGKEEAPVIEEAAVETTPEPVETTPEPVATEQPAVQQPVATQTPVDPEENDQIDRPESGNSDNSGDSGNSGNSGNEGGETVDQYALAQSYIGSDAGTFQSVVGSPSGTEYTISCMEEGAEDGVWYYDGFVVWTLRTADGTETVVDCDAY